MKKGSAEDLLKRIRGPQQLFGAELATVVTAPPDVTIKVEGMDEALPVDVFRIPASCYPLIPGDQLIVIPLRAVTDTVYVALNKMGRNTVTVTIQAGFKFKLQGTDEVIGIDLVKVPLTCYPLIPGEVLTVVPMEKTDAGVVYAALDKLNGSSGPGGTCTLISATPVTMSVDGSGETLDAARLKILSGVSTGEPDVGSQYALIAWQGDPATPSSVKYIVINKA